MAELSSPRQPESWCPTDPPAPTHHVLRGLLLCGQRTLFVVGRLSRFALRGGTSTVPTTAIAAGRHQKTMEQDGQWAELTNTASRPKHTSGHDSCVASQKEAHQFLPQRCPLEKVVPAATPVADHRLHACHAWCVVRLFDQTRIWVEQARKRARTVRCARHVIPHH